MKKVQTKKITKFPAVNPLFTLKILLLGMVFMMMTGYQANAQVGDTLITVRFNNPQFDCETQTYCVDVEFLSNLADQTLFGINVRFFYDDYVLEFLSLGDFATGYSQVEPSPAVTTGSGAAFTFPNGDSADFVNRNVELTTPPGIVISTDNNNWTKLFNVCFAVDDENSLEISSFCPSLVWDMDVDPAFGGFGSVSNGVVMTVVGDLEPSRPVTENVVQYNWQYTGTLTPPFGFPDPTICIPTTCGTSDFGDAPEGVMAYPETGVIGGFPTCLDQSGGFISHLVPEVPLVFFGPLVDAETDGNAGACSPYAPYNNDECFADNDAGLLIPASPHSLDGIGNYVVCTGTGNKLTIAGDTILWGVDLDIDVTNATDQEKYVNLLIDWNRNGIWAYDPTTMAWGNIIPEHSLVNFPIPPFFTGSLSALIPPSIYAGPYQGYMWARFSITEVPVAANWDGSGEFLLGETEDYLFKVDPRQEIPVSDWALALGIFLILTFAVLRIRKS